eukprot:12831164-Alexandrium_andersonii.AAC.1
MSAAQAETPSLWWPWMSSTYSQAVLFGPLVRSVQASMRNKGYGSMPCMRTCLTCFSWVQARSASNLHGCGYSTINSVK